MVIPHSQWTHILVLIDSSKEVPHLHFYKNGVYYARCTITETPTYNLKYIATWKQIMKTFYADGDTRYSVITTKYIRNSAGTLNGLTTYGTSQGREKINNKYVTYNGKITIKTRSNTNIGLHELGNYNECKYSSSSNLKKRQPLESIFYDDQLQSRNKK